MQTELWLTGGSNSFRPSVKYVSLVQFLSPLTMHFRNASWSALVSGYRSGGNFLVALIALKLLGAESYGNVAVMMAIFGIFVAFTSSVFTVLVPKIMGSRSTFSDTESRIGFAAFVLSLASLVLIWLAWLSITAFSHRLESSGIFNRSFWQVVNQGSLIVVAITVSQIYSSLNQALIESAGRLDLAVKTQLVGPIAALCGLSFFAAFGRPVDVPSYLGILFFGAFIDAMIAWLVRRKVSCTRLSLSSPAELVRDMMDLLRSASSIQFSAFMNIFLEPLNKTLLKQFSGDADVAAYDLTMKIIWGLQGIFGAAARIFLHLPSTVGKAVVAAYFRAGSLLTIPVVMVHTLASLLLAFYVNFSGTLEQERIMPLFGIAAVSNIAMIGVTPLYISLIANDDRKFLVLNQLRLTMANIVLSATLIPLLGLVGAAFGLCLAALYNAGAIWRRFGATIAPLTMPSGIPTPLAWRSAIAVVLFISALIIGASKTLNVMLVLCVALATLILLLTDPAIAEMRERILPKGGGGGDVS